MEINASEFKAKCLALIDQVGRDHEPILIRKHGKLVAQLAPIRDENEVARALAKARAWGPIEIIDPFEPVVDEADIEALK